MSISERYPVIWLRKRSTTHRALFDNSGARVYAAGINQFLQGASACPPPPPPPPLLAPKRIIFLTRLCFLAAFSIIDAVCSEQKREVRRLPSPVRPHGRVQQLPPGLTGILSACALRADGNRASLRDRTAHLPSFLHLNYTGESVTLA